MNAVAGSVVVLNRNYQYWTEVSLRKVMAWFVKDKIEIILSDETKEIGSIEFRIKMPLVVRLLNFVGYKPKKEAILYSPEAVYERDNDVCQYWHIDDHGRRFKYICGTADIRNGEDFTEDEGERTVDHILPTSKGGKSDSFENTVCSCRYHNEKVKKNHLPQEVGLELIRKPYVPKRDRNSYVTVKFHFNRNKKAHLAYLEKILGEKI